MKRNFLLSVFILCACSCFAQQKMLTMQDAMLNARTTLAPATLSQLQFYGNTNEYVFLKDGMWMKGNATTEPSLFLTLSQLNEKLRVAGLDSVKSMPAIRFNADGWLMMVGGTKIILNPDSKGSYQLLIPKNLSGKENVEESSAGYVAYLDNHNLFVTAVPRDPRKAVETGADIRVTDDGSADIVYASSVHREEFGISKGIFWSPSGTRLVYYRMDQSMVTDYPIIDWTQTPAKVELIKYPMAGDNSHHVTLGVFDVLTRKTTWIKTGVPAEQYLTNIAWSPDNRYVYIAIVNREQNHMWLNKYDAVNGNFIQTLFEQTDEKYTEPLVPMLFVKNNPAQFIWQSNRDGYNHLYLYDTSGQMLRQLTKGTWEVLDVKGFDSKGENIYISGTMVSPVDRSTAIVNIKSGVMQLLTSSPGVHATVLSADGTNMLDSYSSIDNPRTILLKDLRKKTSKNLLTAANPLSGYSMGGVALFTIKNKSGDSLYCRMYQPANLQAGKKYPVIVYWYGGPHAQLIMNSWNGGAGDYWFQYMAERGYVVLTIDTRGSDNRGKQFEQSIFRRLGDAQMEDLMAGIDFLKTTSFADTERMGLFGWSFGGFMTTDFMLNHPGIFKVAVAGGPVMNWRYYEIMYGERYMDTPQENPEGYAATDLTKQVQKLKGKLLLIHGLQDPVVVQQHSINFMKAAVDAGVQVDYMLYPGHEHNVIGKDRAHLYQKVTDYLVQYLQ